MRVKAVNTVVWVVRDKTENEQSGLVLPSQGKVKPHQGTIVSVGGLVKDGNIKAGKGKKALFHKGVGQEIDFDGQTYLILDDIQIIGVV